MSKISTKELAKHLGLLKRRSSTLSSPLHENEGDDVTKKKKPKEQTFSYLIVMDFESTCWKEKTKGYSNEIIEFPAVLLDVRTGEIIDRFQQYVKPSEHKQLSSFCTELTGVTQDKVESGIPIRMCLTLFDDWVRKWKQEKMFSFVGDAIKSDKKCALVTWTDWDLGVCLKYECRRKKIFYPSYLKCWIDLKKTYKEFYERQPKGLRNALEELNMQFDGREHSGIDDATNTAYLAWRMIKDGNVLVLTKSLDMKNENQWKPKIPNTEKGGKTFKTSTTSSSSNESRSTTFRTPTTKLPGNTASLKVTPPLCECGRRCKRKKVMNPGPNIDRIFYSCPVGKDTGCRYFKWEHNMAAVRGAQHEQSKTVAGGKSELCFQVGTANRQLLKEKCSNLFAT